MQCWLALPLLLTVCCCIVVCAGGDTSPPAAAAGAAATPAEPAISQAGLRHHKPASSSLPPRPQPHLHPSAELAGLSEIEPLLAEGHTQQPPSASPQRPGPRQPHHHQQQQQHAGGAAGGAAGPPGGVQQQWWGTPANWLSDIADGTTGAAAAAQEAATAAVQQAASTMTHAVEEAAATAASWARSMRAVFVEPPAGWGVHEAIKQTGARIGAPSAAAAAEAPGLPLVLARCGLDC